MRRLGVLLVFVAFALAGVVVVTAWQELSPAPPPQVQAVRLSSPTSTDVPENGTPDGGDNGDAHRQAMPGAQDGLVDDTTLTESVPQDPLLASSNVTTNTVSRSATAATVSTVQVKTAGPPRNTIDDDDADDDDHDDPADDDDDPADDDDDHADDD